MRERPILFAGPMVRAILSGEKTVTRRVMKPQPKAVHADDERGGHWWPSKEHQSMLHIEEEMQKWTGLAGHACPYGQPGDRLWVRETWAHVGNTDPGYLTYRATYPECLPPGLERVPADIRDAGYRWRPSIHMPRAYSRILLEITAVRVERLQDISEDQAMAEGVTPRPSKVSRATRMGRDAFAELWASINGAESWDANPWVWVVEFKRITP